MKRLVLALYELLPKSLVRSLGRNRLLKPLRDRMLRNNDGTFIEAMVDVKRQYNRYLASFHYFAAIKDAGKAKKKGVENTLLNNSFKLLDSLNIMDNAIVFDVGANFGYLTLVWAKTVCWPHGKVYCFEPNPRLVSSITKSVAANELSETVVINPVAVGNENGTIELFLASTTSNLNAKGLEAQSGSTQVKIVSLDEYARANNITRCDLLKIDVDGPEHDILLGAANFIKTLKPILIIETNNDARILEICKSYGYHVFNMNLVSIQDSNEVPSNIFCVHNQVASTILNTPQPQYQAQGHH